MSCELWPITWPADLNPEDLPGEAVAAAREGASNLLWALTGRVYGVCSVRERYRAQVGVGCVGPYKDRAGYWQNGVGGGGACCAITLAQQPVRSIEEVAIDGVPLVQSGNWVRQGNRVLRLGACWPSAVECEVAPIEVEYTYGAGFPAGSAPAVGEVAAELLAPLRGKDCRLPTRATSVTRNNVTVTMADAQQLADSGLLGLPLADMLIRALNPGRLRLPSRVHAVDGGRRA